MDPETLERLMLDDALGALAEDVRALVMDRVAASGAAAQAGAYRRTVEAARAALGPRRRETLPPLPTARLRREAARRRRRRLTGRVAALAACLVLGLGIGYLAFSRAAATAPAPAPVRVAQGGPLIPAVPAADSAEAGGAGGFWSSRRLVERAVAAGSQEAVRVTWVSPVQNPRIGE
jgi:hypothetical protein